MKFIIVTPVWNTEIFHPHMTRIQQWIEVMQLMNCQVLVYSLSGSAKKSKYLNPSIIEFLGVHPSFKKGKRIKKKGVNDIKEIRLRLKRIITANNKPFDDADLILLSHPMLVPCIINFNNKIILDFPDAPKSENDILKWGYKSLNEFKETTRGIEFSFLHSKEATFLIKSGLKNQIHTLIPSISIANPSKNKMELKEIISIHGRKSKDSLVIFNELYQVLKSNRLTKTIEINVCGELSNLISSCYEVNNIGVVSDMKSKLRNTICPVITKQNPTGISMRIIDIIESGGILVASNSALIGYEITDYPFTFQDIKNLPEIINTIILNPNEAISNMKILQEKFIKMSDESNSKMYKLLIN